MLDYKHILVGFPIRSALIRFASIMNHDDIPTVSFSNLALIPILRHASGLCGWKLEAEIVSGIWLAGTKRARKQLMMNKS